MFNSRKIKELEDRVFRLEYPNGKLLCLHQVSSDPYNPYKKRNLIFEYKMNHKIILDSGYYSLVGSKIERVSNNLFKIEAMVEHCWIASCKTIDYYLVDISKNCVIGVDKDMKVVL